MEIPWTLAVSLEASLTCMSNAALKKKIKALVEKEQSIRKLELAYALLTEHTAIAEEPVAPYSSAGKAKAKSPLAGSARTTMNETVRISEREFAEGKGIPLEQFEQEMDAILDELFSGEPSSQKP